MPLNKKLIIIPTYNERRNIEKLLREILVLPENFEVLVVDDNSPDGTGEIVSALEKVEKRIHSLHRSGKMGLGTAYIAGFRWALEHGFEAVFTMDADFSHSPAYLGEISRLLSENDLVIGSRYIPGGGVEGWPLRRKLLSGMGNLYARLVSGLPVKDTTSGFMALRKDLVQGIFAANMHSEGYSFLMEIKYRSWKWGYRIKETPIIFVDRIAGRSKISKKIIFEAIFIVWRLRLSGGKNNAGK